MPPRTPSGRRVLNTALALALAVPLGVAPAIPAAAADAPSATPLGQRTLDEQALYFVSYDGLVNNGSYQQSGIITHGDHQYAAWYTESRHAVVARRYLDGGDWHTVQLPHRLTVDDSHNSISLGVSTEDGRLHVAMDTHNTPVYYTRSAAGLLTDDAPWTVDSFEPVGRD
ncbi:BNR-4 repeat-containing protein, partial [Nocardiopsis lucentensis]|uniref:BNR-4 repeat-containing protein n=1 Tax=Nocardiopsis lucentensis TaxID=53441 RepID=UPI00047670F3